MSKAPKMRLELVSRYVLCLIIIVTTWEILFSIFLILLRAMESFLEVLHSKHKNSKLAQEKGKILTQRFLPEAKD